MLRASGCADAALAAEAVGPAREAAVTGDGTVAVAALAVAAVAAAVAAAGAVAAAAAVAGVVAGVGPAEGAAGDRRARRCDYCTDCYLPLRRRWVSYMVWCVKSHANDSTGYVLDRATTV